MDRAPIEPLVLYVHIEHARARAGNERLQHECGARIAALAPSQLEVLYAWYGDDATMRALATRRPLAVFVSGSDTDWPDYAHGTPTLDPLKDWIASSANATTVLA